MTDKLKPSKGGLFSQPVKKDPKEYDSKGNVKYPGKLGTPKDRSISIKEAVDVDLEMMNELIELYEIDPSNPNRWFLLSYQLANQHVPGFRYKKFARKGGAPIKWKTVTRQELVDDVFIVMGLFPHYTAKDACKWLSNINFYEQNPPNLYNQYQNAKKDPKVKLRD